MQTENSVFGFQEAERQLFATQHGDSQVTPEVIDYEMQFGKSRTKLKITCFSQEGLEYFVRNYGHTYRVLSLYDCRWIRDFSPLGELPYLEAIRIDWSQRNEKLWDFSKNTSLKVLSIAGSRKLVYNPLLLQTAKTLEEVRFWGDTFTNYPLESMDCFQGMDSLKRIDLIWIKLENHSMDVLRTLPNLEQFHFDPGMLTTEEIAWIVAKYPKLYGRCLCAYNKEDALLNDVRVCGFRKPGLDLPQHQKRLDQYIAQFDALVEKYRNES